MGWSQGRGRVCATVNNAEQEVLTSSWFLLLEIGKPNSGLDVREGIDGCF